MTFLNPAFLWALPLAAFPFLLHLLFLQRARRLPFSDLALLRQVYLRMLPSSRLRQWLLILVRCLMLALLVLAFSRPVLRGTSSSGAAADEEGLRLVVLTDASYSMSSVSGGKTRLDQAKRAALALFSSLKPRDRVAVSAFTDRLENPLAWTSPAEARRLLQEVEVLPRPTDLRPALEAAYALLAREKAERKGVLVLSDNARHGFRRLEKPDLLPFFDPAVRVLGLDDPESADNAWVAGVELAGNVRGRPELKVQVRLEGPPRSDWGLRLVQYGRSSQEKRLRLVPPRAETAFRLDPSEDAVVWGRLELQKDGLALDDSYAYAFRAPARAKVLILHASPDYLKLPRGGYFLKEVFQSPGGGLGPFDVDFADFGRFQASMLDGCRAVVLAGFKKVPPAVAAAVGSFVRRGGGLWVLPDPGLEAGFGLDDVLPGRLTPETVPGGPLKLKPEDLPDPEPWRFHWKDFELERISLRQSFGVVPKRGAAVWAELAGGRAAWLFGAAGQGKVLLWSTPLDADWTNLPLKPVFAPLLSALLGELCSSSVAGGNLMVHAGQPFVREWPAGEELPTALSIVTPDRRRFSPYLKGRRLEFPATDRPGLYQLSFNDARGRRLEPFAVNLDVESGESEPAARSPLPWKKLDPERLASETLAEFYGVEARGGFLYLILVLFGLETLLSRRRDEDASGRPGTRAREAVAAGLLLACLVPPARAQNAEPRPVSADRFFWTQLKTGSDWDPYPGVQEEVLKFMAETTAIAPSPARRVTSLDDTELFGAPFLVLAGREAPGDLSDSQVQRLRAYLTSGGFLWIEDVSGLKSSPYDRWVRRTLKAVFPDAELAPVPASHALYRSFYLLRSVAGRTSLSPSMEGLDWGGRTVVLYSRNDLLGAWVRDALGNPLLACAPGGESQRFNAKKVTANIVMYALTGTYKLDAVHQPFILEKLRRGQP